MDRSKIPARIVMAVYAMLLIPASLWAAHPLGVEDTETQGTGHYQFEFTEDYVKDNSIKSSEIKAVITGGVAEHIDVAMEVPYLFLHPSPETGRHEYGLGDVVFKLKHRLFETGDKKSLAYLIHADIPTGDDTKGLGTGKLEWGGRLIGSKEWDALEMHLNMGYDSHGSALKRGDFTLDYAVSFGAAVEYEVVENLELVAEFSGERRKETGEYTRPLFLLGGVIYEITEAWSVDAGIRAGLNEDAEDYALLAGVAVRF